MDAYDHMVAYLAEHPNEIIEAWSEYQGVGKFHPCHPLFVRATPSGNLEFSDCGRRCGCLTQIVATKGHGLKGFAATTRALTIAIAGDERLPRGPGLIKVDHLPIFAGWQRRIDKILNRTPPVWNGPPCAKPEVEMEAAPSVGVEVVSD